MASILATPGTSANMFMVLMSHVICQETHELRRNCILKMSIVINGNGN